MPAIRMVVEYDKKFLKQYDKADPKIRLAFKKRRRLFQENPFDPQLRNHALSGRYHGFRSINITGDWRALYRAKGKLVIFEALGTHSQLYH